MTRFAADDYWQWESWVESANEDVVGFPLQSLPYCSFIPADGIEAPAHLGVGIGSWILDLHQLAASGLLSMFDEEIQAACSSSQLNQLMGCGLEDVSSLRQRLIGLLRGDANANTRNQIEMMLVAQSAAQFLMPVAVRNYTDFYASIDHARNIGSMFRPDQPLLPNYKWVPIGYHGRASSLVASGTGIHRPLGQTKANAEQIPQFGPTSQLDYELEVAAYIGTGNPLGSRIAVSDAERHIFGFSLLNDWSARDIQAWEYQPLGPFLGKSFATSISPWVVPIEALEPFRVPMKDRAPDDPKPLPYLSDPSLERRSGIDLTLEVWLSTARMRQETVAPVRLSQGSSRDIYWSFAQMIAHHTSNGCNLMEGDLIASGTVSGPREGSQGCLMEITQRGKTPLHLPNGEVRTFLEDGDEIVVRGWCGRDGFRQISLGECRGTILAAAGS